LVELYILAMLLKKKNTPKSTKMIIDDIRYSFNKIMSQNTPILAITITHTHCKSQEELRFWLTNKFFNKIYKDNKQNLIKVNYLFIIEYPEKLSRGNMIPDNLNVHTHIVLGTTLSESIIKKYINEVFVNSDGYVIDISKRDDRFNYVNYLTKQSPNNYLTNDSYNYKIEI
jgi:hypothetical protein